MYCIIHTQPEKIKDPRNWFKFMNHPRSGKVNPCTQGWRMTGHLGGCDPGEWGWVQQGVGLIGAGGRPNVEG